MDAAGGPLSNRERQAAFRRRQGATPRGVTVCGEMSGVNRHKYLREPLCGLCRPVNAAEQRRTYDPVARAARYQTAKKENQ